MQKTAIRLGIIGMGNAGTMHAKALISGSVKGGVLSAVTDSARRLTELSSLLPESCAKFESYDAMLASGKCDAIIVATPHPSHPQLSIQAFETGHHVFCEKPAGVDALSARLMNEAADKSGKLFCMDFNRRLEPFFLRLKDLLDSGETGLIRRASWVSTDWFRTEAYYASANWRGTWAGEGGGALLNQCVHILDLWQCLFGMPSRLRSFCHFGKHHDIEVEDEVTSYMEYANGMTGSIILSTGESPGSNRLEIACDRGRIVLDGRRITFNRTTESISHFSRSKAAGFGEPPRWDCEIPIPGTTDLSCDLLRNFVSALCGEALLTVDGREGIKSLQLANSMLLSTWIDNWAPIPFDEANFKAMLDEKARLNPPSKKKEGSRVVLDLTQSFK